MIGFTSSDYTWYGGKEFPETARIQMQVKEKLG